jgi:hypothetical protein
MTGIVDKNRYAFYQAARKLKTLGYRIVNPWDLGQSSKMTWEDFLRRDIGAMMKTCNGVATLEGWKKSKGASLEVYIAKALKWPVHTVAYWRKNALH